jgi:hypothetical protein
VSSAVRSRLDAVAGPAAAAVLSLVAAVQALRWWDWRPGTPLSLSGDAPHVLMQVRMILDEGWYASTSALGAPFGVNGAWFTTADVLNFATIRVIGLLGGDAATTSALFFLAGFPLAALTAYWLARELGTTRPAAVAVGVLFSVVPGHQEWFHHLWLAAYWMVPLALWLVVRVAQGTPLLDVGPRRRWSTVRLALVVLAVGFADVYYVAFTLLLLAVVLLIRLGTGARPRLLVPGAAVTAAVGLLCGLTLAVATRGRSGDLVTGALPAQRGIGESEVYAGKIVELVLPWSEHRAAPLRFLSQAYGIAAQPSVERPALGFVALLGVVGLLWLVLTSLVTRRRIAPLTGLLAALALVCLAFYTRAGLGSLVALFVTPQIRTWSRFVVLIALLGLLAVGLWASDVGRRHGRRVSWAAAAALLLVGVLDQTSPGAAPDHTALRAQRAELQDYTRDLHEAVGSCPVFQLPVVSYPEEPPPGSMGDYDHLLPYLTSAPGTAWSYGAIRGTARADWQLALPVADPPSLTADLADAGFCAVSVDRDGYDGATDPTAALTAAAGQPVASADGERLTAFDLRPLASGAEAARDAVLRPVVVSMEGSLIEVEDGEPRQHTGPRAALRVANMGAATVAVTLSMRISGVGNEPRRVTLSGALQETRQVDVADDRSEQLTVELQAAPGTTELTLEATGDVVTIPGTEGAGQAVLEVSDLRASGPGPVNVASLQQFALATPPSLR